MGCIGSSSYTKQPQPQLQPTASQEQVNHSNVDRSLLRWINICEDKKPSLSPPHALRVPLPLPHTVAGVPPPAQPQVYLPPGAVSAPDAKCHPNAEQQEAGPQELTDSWRLLGRRWPLLQPLNSRSFEVVLRRIPSEADMYELEVECELQRIGEWCKLLPKRVTASPVRQSLWWGARMEEMDLLNVDRKVACVYIPRKSGMFSKTACVDQRAFIFVDIGLLISDERHKLGELDDERLDAIALTEQAAKSTFRSRLLLRGAWVFWFVDFCLDFNTILQFIRQGDLGFASITASAVLVSTWTCASRVHFEADAHELPIRKVFAELILDPILSGEEPSGPWGGPETRLHLVEGIEAIIAGIVTPYSLLVDYYDCSAIFIFMILSTLMSAYSVGCLKEAVFEDDLTLTKRAFNHMAWPVFPRILARLQRSAEAMACMLAFGMAAYPVKRHFSNQPILYRTIWAGQAVGGFFALWFMQWIVNGRVRTGNHPLDDIGVIGGMISQVAGFHRTADVAGFHRKVSAAGQCQLIAGKAILIAWTFLMFFGTLAAVPDGHLYFRELFLVAKTDRAFPVRTAVAWLWAIACLCDIVLLFVMRGAAAFGLAFPGLSASSLCWPFGTPTQQEEIDGGEYAYQQLIPSRTESRSIQLRS